MAISRLFGALLTATFLVNSACTQYDVNPLTPRKQGAGPWQTSVPTDCKSERVRATDDYGRELCYCVDGAEPAYFENVDPESCTWNILPGWNAVPEGMVCFWPGVPWEAHMHNPGGGTSPAPESPLLE